MKIKHLLLNQRQTIETGIPNNESLVDTEKAIEKDPSTILQDVLNIESFWKRQSLAMLMQVAATALTIQNAKSLRFVIHNDATINALAAQDMM